MAKTPLFSTYRQGENRVTASMLAVFERIDASLVERILASASGESSLAFVTFANQMAKKQGSVPDAVISANFRYLFEVKTARNAVNSQQLKMHRRNFDKSFRDQRLFVVTPDAAAPAEVLQQKDQRVVWLSFLAISQAIDDVLTDGLELVSEQTRFLLRELQALFVQDGLIDPQEDTVIVAARDAYGEYEQHHAYICQPGRAFRAGLSRMAFYKDAAIQPPVPAILARRDNVNLTLDVARTLNASRDPVDQAIGRLVEHLHDAKSFKADEMQQVFLLSPPDDERTLMLDHPIKNTKLGISGKRVAFLQAQRYTRSDVLTTNPLTTSELEARNG